jgi:hypothetical protein
MIPPAEFEAISYHQGTPSLGGRPNNPSFYETRGGSHEFGCVIGALIWFGVLL